MKIFLKYVLVYNIVLVTGITLAIFASNVNIKMNLKIDSIFIILGNLIIAFGIGYVLNSRQKKDEIAVDHCFKDISEILELLIEIRTAISNLEPKDNTLTVKLSPTREITAKTSLLNEQIFMLEIHRLIDIDELNNIKDLYSSFESSLTDTKNIKEDWFDTILKLHRHLLKLKSGVLKKYSK